MKKIAVCLLAILFLVGCGKLSDSQRRDVREAMNQADRAARLNDPRTSMYELEDQDQRFMDALRQLDDLPDTDEVEELRSCGSYMYSALVTIKYTIRLVQLGGDNSVNKYDSALNDVYKTHREFIKAAQKVLDKSK